MKHNPHKSVSANSYGIDIFYTDTFKSSSINYDETSLLKNIQIKGPKFKGKNYQLIESGNLTRIQIRLYNDAMYGLNNYTKKQLKEMPYVQKMSIKTVAEQTQFKLNLWKHELIHQKVGSFLTTVFHKSDFAKAMATYPKSINSWDICTITFKQLGIRKEQIIQKLMEFELLPENFYDLSL